MAKVRIFSLAKQLGLRSEALVAALAELGVEGATPATAIDEDTARTVAQLLAEQAAQARQVAAAAGQPEAVSDARKPEAKAEEEEEEEWEEEEEAPEPELVPTFYQAADPLAELEKHLAQMDIEAHKFSEVSVMPLPHLVARPQGARPDYACDVPPVVTVLGHVDHGKTTLLDALRNTNVTAGEFGGITQHIGASEIEYKGKRIVFIDTPGHAAFTQMRARGAQVTDIAILIIAADDGVMPQTVEAIGHAKAANVPIIVAINKIDLPGADPTRVKQQLLEYELVPEEWGGDVVVCEISAVTRQGLDELLEMIILVSDVQQLWGDPRADFAGIVVESKLDASQGALTTVLLRRGQLKIGDVLIAGTAYGRIRRLRDSRGKSIKSMEVGRPVEVVGMNAVPESGEIITACASLKVAQKLVDQRAVEARKSELSGAGVRLRALYKELYGEGRTDLNIVLKGDVWGTVEAVVRSLEELGNELDEINLTVVHRAVGEITESDLSLAVASKAIIIGFNVGASDSVRRMADDEHVEIRTYNVIYELLQDIQDAMYGLLEPVFEEQKIGTAQVLQLFRIGRNVIAGCRILNGKLQRSATIRVTRGRDQIFEGTLDTLRHFDRDVQSLDATSECGISSSGFHTWREGDQIEAFMQVEVERKKAASASASAPRR